MDHLAALGTVRRLVRRGVGEFFEVVFIGAAINVELCREIIPALWTVLPAARMLLLEVIAAECVPVMIPMATVAGIREQHVAILVIADPLTAALGLGQLARLAAETAASA
jgi:hypothetical protein